MLAALAKQHPTSTFCCIHLRKRMSTAFVDDVIDRVIVSFEAATRELRAALNLQEEENRGMAARIEELKIQLAELKQVNIDKAEEAKRDCMVKTAQGCGMCGCLYYDKMGQFKMCYLPKGHLCPHLLHKTYYHQGAAHFQKGLYYYNIATLTRVDANDAMIDSNAADDVDAVV